MGHGIHKTWVTSDTHFSHYFMAERWEFSSIEVMNETIIKNWNSVVGVKEQVYFLGDLTMLSKYKIVKSFFRQLNGIIFVVPGNHDKWPRTKPYISKSNKPVKILPNVHDMKYKGTNITLCHYPMREWKHSQKGSIHLYGHVHGNSPDTDTSMYVGTDSNEFYPYLLDRILERFGKDTNELKPYGDFSPKLV